MVTDTEGYTHIIEYLSENLSFFENTSASNDNTDTLIAVIEQELSEQVISVCSQNDNLTLNQRNIIIREIDAIMYDLEEILSCAVNNPATEQQSRFIKEFASLIKNLFDTEINNKFLSAPESNEN